MKQLSFDALAAIDRKGAEHYAKHDAGKGFKVTLKQKVIGFGIVLLVFFGFFFFILIGPLLFVVAVVLFGKLAIDAIRNRGKKSVAARDFAVANGFNLGQKGMILPERPFPVTGATVVSQDCHFYGELDEVPFWHATIGYQISNNKSDRRQSSATGSATMWNSTNFSFKELVLQFGATLPTLYIVPDLSAPLFGQNYPPDLTTVSLEGDFDSYFTLKTEQGKEREALEIITPDVMQTIINYGSQLSIFTTGNYMVIYSYVAGLDYLTTRTQIELGQMLIKEVKEKFLFHRV